MRKFFVSVGCLAAVMLAACTGESNLPTPSGSGFISAINAIPTSPDIRFAIEERTVDNAAYQSISRRAEFDNFRYTFNFDVTFPGETEQRRVASKEVKIEDEMEYVFVISGDLEAPEITVWESAVDSRDDTTVFEARFAHLAESTGPIDVYFDAPGVAPAAGAEVATLEFTEMLPPMNFLAGDFVVTLTPTGQPGQILYQSNTLSLAAQGKMLFAMFDSTANDPGPSPVSVVLANADATSRKLPAADTPAAIRFFHASMPTGATDIYTDDTLNDRILANHQFRDVTSDLDIDPAGYTLTYTAANNSGSILLESGISIFPGTIHHQFLYTNNAGELEAIQSIPDRRSVSTQVKFQFTHTAANHPVVDLYIVDAGTDIEDTFPRVFNLQPGAATNTATIAEGDLEMYLTTGGEKTVVAGPFALTTSLGDVIQVVSYDTVDPTRVDLVSIPLP